MIGQTFGYLTVIEFAGRTSGKAKMKKWLCKCRCGGTCTPTISALKLGKTKSCGCLVSETAKKRAYKLEGKRFGLLVVKHRNGTTPGKAKLSTWLTECDCGNSHTAVGTNLVYGHTISCGCVGKAKIRKLKRRQPGECGFNQVFKQYVRGARERNLEFVLTKLEFRALTTQNCHYCGESPSLTRSFGPTEEAKAHSSYTYNGLDRYDNSRGYTLDNVVPCCRKCNIAKWNLPADEFLLHIKKILEYQKSLSA